VRADAQRNYDRIVETARTIFREQGYDASLDLIAKQAGVGPGTLYRHFPSRDDLIDAVMQSWVDHVEQTAEKAIAHEGGPREVLLNWFEEYVRLISVHKGGPAKITGAMGDDGSPIRTKCQVLQSAGGRVLDRLHDQDAIRDDVTPLQVARLVGGVATVADQSDLGRDAVRPMLEVLADGLLK
jgi:AcrR family transcriptional regulator